jgi:hypothetical protein
LGKIGVTLAETFYFPIKISKFFHAFSKSLPEPWGYISGPIFLGWVGGVGGALFNAGATTQTQTFFDNQIVATMSSPLVVFLR